MPCFNGSVCCEDDLVAHLLQVRISLLPQELQCDKAGMSLVKVEGLHIPVSKVTKDPQSAYSQYELLAQPVSVVSSVELICQSPVLSCVFWEVRVKEEDRDGMARISDYCM
ncbi:hypothetical protein SDC9_134141 [bioreactor metagenome]|uniref:Uncharacterized protein n=1 Tax=bioreactor metagenome TaxID=1076179 RepID=A0A645DDC7_9ZZZZ